MSQLPSHLRSAIGRGHAKEDWPRLVAQLELFGVPVRVVRLQLGEQRGEEYGQVREIYRSPEPQPAQEGQ